MKNALTIENKALNTGVANGTIRPTNRYPLKNDPNNQLHRIAPRHQTLGLMAVVGDGKSSFYCVVDELSANGLRFVQVPTDFDETSKECTALVLAPSDDIAMFARPRWAKATNKGMYKTVGFQIENPPDNWQDFIQGLKRKEGDYYFLLSEDDRGGTN